MNIEHEGPKVFPIQIISEDDDTEIHLHANGSIESLSGSLDSIQATLENIESFYYADNEQNLFLWLVLQIHKLREEVKGLKRGDSSDSK